MTDELRAEIAQILRKMLYPTPFMRWMEGLTGAERIGRIKKSKKSVLTYGLERYIQTQLPELPANQKVTIHPFDDCAFIKGTNPLEPENNWLIEFPYPYWLRDFLADGENDLLLEPDCEEKLGELLQTIYEWCRSHPPYDILVSPAS